MSHESRALVVAVPATRVARWASVAPFVLLAMVGAGALGTRALTRWLETPVPAVAGVDVYAAIVNLTPVELTITAGSERLPFVSTHDAVLTDATLWRRMHLADWNVVPEALRHDGLDAVLVRYHPLLFAPARWDRMTAHDWDGVPQPVRVLAYRHMVEYWSGFYDVGAAYDWLPQLMSDTLAAIVMSESWFDHRAVNAGYGGQRDVGLAQASEFARRRMEQLHASGDVDVLLTEGDYFNPWSATRFVAIWMARLLDDTAGDLDFAVRAYNRGLANAFDERGDAYLAAVHERRDRFIRNRGAPEAWDYLWRVDRAARRDAWPWIVHSPRGRPDTKALRP